MAGEPVPVSARILVLEDDEAFRSMLVQALQRHGYQVEGVGRALDAIERTRQQPFDLVVADIRMEGASGLDAIQEVQTHHPGVNSIVITGFSTEADSIRAVRLGVGDYLKKPFPLQVFLDSVERVLARRRLQQRSQEQQHTWQLTLLWALRQAARQLSLLAPEEANAIEVSEGLMQLARELEWSEERALELALAFLWKRLEEVHQEPPGYVRSCFPAGVTAAYQALRQADSCEGQMVRAVEGHEAAAELALAWGRVRQGQQLPRSSPGSSARSLLALAGALAEGGQVGEAGQAFHQVLERSAQSPREALEAQLGLAHLARRAGQNVEIRHWCEQAIQSAHKVGPVTAGWVALRSSLLAEDPVWNEQAIHSFTTTELASGIALAQLASRRWESDLDERSLASLAVLMQPENVSLFLESAEWLWPLLLRHPQPHPSWERAVRALTQNAPAELLSLAQFGNLDPAMRLRAVPCLRALESERALEILQQWSGDANDEVRQLATRALEQGRGVPAVAMLRIFSLGPFTVYRGEERIADKAWKSQKVRYLLAFLAAYARVVSEDLLLEAFWPDDLEKGRRNLYTATSYLRSALGCTPQSDYLQRSPAGLQLHAQLPWWHDLSELEKGLLRSQQQRQAGQHEAGLDTLAKVANLYRGPYLEGCYYEWAEVRRNQLEQRMVEALLSLASGRLDQQRFGETLECSGRVLEIDPCCQEAYRLAMKSYLESGRAEEVLRLFQQARQLLARELELEPSIELIELQQRALLNL